MGDPADGLHRNHATAAEIIGEFPDDLGFGKALLDVAVPPYRARVWMIIRVVRRRLEQIAFAFAEVRGVRGFGGRDSGNRRQIRIVNLDDLDRILRLILAFGGKTDSSIGAHAGGPSAACSRRTGAGTFLPSRRGVLLRAGGPAYLSS